MVLYKDYKNYMYEIINACMDADILPEDKEICEDSMIEIDKFFREGKPVKDAIDYMLRDSLESRLVNDWR